MYYVAQYDNEILNRKVQSLSDKGGQLLPGAASTLEHIDIVHMIRGTIPSRAMKERAMEMGVGNDFYAEWEWFDPSQECWSN